MNPALNANILDGPVLVIDVGGTHVKVQSESNLAKQGLHIETGEAGPANPAARNGSKDPIKIDSGKTLTAAMMVNAVRKAITWPFAMVAMGYPGPVLHGRPVHEPANLGAGWVGFDFQREFGCPVKIINDAAMQALGSYQGGRMLFLGLGTGLGSTMIVDGMLEPMELAHLPYKKRRTYEDYVGLRGLRRLGKKRWRREVNEVVAKLTAALEPDYVVLGGGNSKYLKDLPAGVKLGANENAFLGGVRLWRGLGDVWNTKVVDAVTV